MLGTEREFSDNLLILLLKARMPEKYADRVRVVHCSCRRETDLDLGRLADDELEQLDHLLNKAAGRSDSSDGPTRAQMLARGAVEITGGENGRSA